MKKALALLGMFLLIALGAWLSQSRSTREIYPQQCCQKLLKIHRLASIYAGSAGKGFYPHSPEGGIASLQVLLDSSEGLRPELFVCRASGIEPAMADEKGRFRLDAGHCSYEMVPWKLSLKDPPDAIFAYDRTPHAGRIRNVVFLDGSMEALDEAEFRKRFEADRARLGVRDRDVVK